MQILKGGILTGLVDLLPQPERYTYVFEGNSQVLDHILVSRALLSGGDDDDDDGGGPRVIYDAVHVNADFAVQDSDHDPSVARLFAKSEGEGTQRKAAAWPEPRGGFTLPTAETAIWRRARRCVIRSIP